VNYYPWSDNEQGTVQDPLRQPNTGSNALGRGSSGQLIVRSPQAPPMDLGSQVAARRNLEFSAGQRSHRISTGSYTKA
jgi:hypothetical protein